MWYLAIVPFYVLFKIFLSHAYKYYVIIKLSGCGEKQQQQQQHAIGYIKHQMSV